MRVAKHSLLFCSASLALSGCGSLGPLTDFGKSKGTLAESETVDVTTAVDAAAGADFAINDTSEISGTTISIPAGALAINTEVTVGVGATLFDESVAQDLQFEENQSATPAGPTVVIDSKDLVDAAQPMQLAIPLGEQQNLLLQAGTFAIVYKVKKASEQGQVYVGIITDVEHSGSTLKFATTHFGAFQAISLSSPITQPREVKSLGTITTRRSETELTGLWVSACNNRNDKFAGSETHSVKSSIKFSGDRLLYRETTFQKADCIAPLFLHMVEAKLTIGGVVAAVPNAKELNVTFDQIYLAPGSAKTADIWNEAAMCGYTDWVAGEPRPAVDACDGSLDTIDNITDSGTEPDSTSQDPDSCSGEDDRLVPGSTYYQIYAIAGDELLLGVDHNAETCTLYGDSAANRPIKLDVKGSENHFIRK